MPKINDSIRALVKKILLWQLALILMLCILIEIISGSKAASSMLMGGMTYWIPTLIFLWRVSAHAGARAATRFVVAFFSGEVIKLFLSGVLFICAAKYFSLELVYGLMGLIGAIVAYWIASCTMLLKER